MTAVWVLLFAWASITGTDRGSGILSAEFNGQAACENARTALVQSLPGTKYAICVAKGPMP